MAVIEFTPKQQEAMDCLASELYNFILFGGAMAGGKTFWGLSALLIMCEIFPKSRWCVIREDLEKIRTTTIPSFKKLNASGKLRESPYEYTHPNGSVILFKGENFDNDKELLWLRGLEVNGFLFEEINECRKITWEIAFSRAGRWECTPRPAPVLLATCNPADNWVKTDVYDLWEKDSLPVKWKYIQSKVTDNPHLTPEYLENLKNMPTFRYMALVEGDWNVQLKVGGEFYKCFELDQHVGDFKYDPEQALHVSFDDNVNPYLPCGIFQLRKVLNPLGIIIGWDIVMIHEFANVTPRNTVELICQDICAKYKGHEAGMFIYGDATANKQDTKLEKGYNFYRLIRDYLKEFRPQEKVLNANPSVVMRGQWINTVLEKELGGLRIKIDRSCKKTIIDFVKLKEAADGTKLKEMETGADKVRYQKYGHFTDLFDYLMVSAFSTQFATWLKGGAAIKVTTGRNVSKNSY